MRSCFGKLPSSTDNSPRNPSFCEHCEFHRMLCNAALSGMALSSPLTVLAFVGPNSPDSGAIKPWTQIAQSLDWRNFCLLLPQDERLFLLDGWCAAQGPTWGCSPDFRSLFGPSDGLTPLLDLLLQESELGLWLQLSSLNKATTSGNSSRN